MTKDQIIDEAFTVFSSITRPDNFTNFQHCAECKEHNETLLAYEPRSITRKALGTMGWDPITFTSDHGFKYFLPGLIRVVLTESGNNNYYEQFLWHTIGEGNYDRIKTFTNEERKVVLKALQFLLDNKAEEIEFECLEEDILNAIEKWT